MKKFSIYFAISFLVLLIVACSSDPEGDQFINYDGGNNSSPILPGGEYEMGVYFPGTLMGDYSGNQIKNIRYYVYTPPDQILINIYEGSSSTQPGTLLYSQPAVGLIRDNAWNIHSLENAFELDGAALWVAIYFDHDSPQQSIGCDSGPADTRGGDWLYQSDDMSWKTFRERTGENVNWNIRLELESN